MPLNGGDPCILMVEFKNGQTFDLEACRRDDITTEAAICKQWFQVGGFGCWIFVCMRTDLLNWL